MANWRKHGLTFAEGCTVFDDHLAKIFRDSDHSEVEAREIVIGQSSTGKLLLVCFTELALDRVRIISAREANRIERRDYEEAV